MQQNLSKRPIQNGSTASDNTLLPTRGECRECTPNHAKTKSVRLPERTITVHPT